MLRVTDSAQNATGEIPKTPNSLWQSAYHGIGNFNSPREKVGKAGSQPQKEGSLYFDSAFPHENAAGIAKPHDNHRVQQHDRNHNHGRANGNASHHVEFDNPFATFTTAGPVVEQSNGAAKPAKEKPARYAENIPLGIKTDSPPSPNGAGVADAAQPNKKKTVSGATDAAQPKPEQERKKQEEVNIGISYVNSAPGVHPSYTEFKATKDKDGNIHYVPNTTDGEFGTTVSFSNRTQTPFNFRNVKEITAKPDGTIVVETANPKDPNRGGLYVLKGDSSPQIREHVVDSPNAATVANIGRVSDVFRIKNPRTSEIDRVVTNTRTFEPKQYQFFVN